MLRGMATSSLTSQIDEIKTTLATLLEADRKDEALEMFVTVLSQLATDHDRLQHQLRLLLKNRFGRKTEKIDPAQLRLFLEELRQAAEKGDAPAGDATRPVVAHVRRKPIERRGSRPALPESLPREVGRLGPVAAGAEALDTIAAEIRRRVLASYVVQADDTPLTVLDSQKPGGSKRGFMWAYLGDASWVAYDYRPTRSASGPCEFLGLREGWVQADAAGAFDPLFALGRAQEAGCWSHSRRYYVEALETDKRTALAIAWIGQLFEVEREAADRTPDERITLRQERSQPGGEGL